MDHTTQPPPTDPVLQLQRAVYDQIAHTLHAMLPPPVAGTPEDPESDPELALARRDRAAIAQAAALAPANADEAELAAHYVAIGAHASDCLRLAVQYAADTKIATKLNAQSAAMMRAAQAHRSLLLRVQAVRRKREANAATRDQDARTRDHVLRMMMDALGNPPPAPAEAPPAPAEAQLPSPAPAVVPAAAAPPRRPVLRLVETGEPPDLSAEADTYAMVHPRRARLIRKLGRLPSNWDFAAPKPELVHAIVTGKSPALLALDTPTDAPA
jgi:hypothetical protein